MQGEGSLVLMVHTDINFNRGTFADNYTFRDPGEMPGKLRAFVCLCDTTLGKRKLDYDYALGVPICGRCDKMLPYYTYRCLECERVFLKNFHHPTFCRIDPFCWDHLDKTLEIPECGHYALNIDRERPMKPWNYANDTPDLTDFDPFEGP